MPRIVSIWLPRWPIQRFLVAQSNAPRSPDAVDGRHPFILTVDAAGGPRIAAASKPAETEGLAAGGLVADARAKVPGLQTRPAVPEADARALHRLGLWAMRYTPSVAVYREADGADGLFLDVTGASHLAGGEEALLADIVKRLRHFRLGARAALADTPGAAWALSRFHAQNGCILTESTDPGPALADLPLAALRLADDLVQTLRRLGFTRIGDLIGKPRAPFAARFDSILLKRLDQAMGRREEALILIEPPPLYHRSRQLLEPVVSQAAVVHVATRLMRDLVPTLVAGGVAARALQLRLFRVDGEVRTIHIGLAAATRDPAHVARLVELDLERLGETIDAGFGFETISLTATVTEKIGPRQARLSLREGRRDAPPADAGERRAELIDALHQRLGPDTVHRLHPVARHDPARAEAARDAAGPAPAWPPAAASRLRPPLFLDRPEPLQILATRADGLPDHVRWRGAAHRITALQGPERIAGPWWEAAAPALPDKPGKEEYGWGKMGEAEPARPNQNDPARRAVSDLGSTPRSPLPASEERMKARGSGNLALSHAAASSGPSAQPLTPAPSPQAGRGSTAFPDGESPKSQKRNRFEDGEATRDRAVLLPASLHKDYYVAETQAGQRFWLSHDGRQSWYLQGLFA